jgi:hypothetical protein
MIRMALKILWTLESCKNDALKYTTKKLWNDSNPNAYMAAYRNGWLSECCQHMEELKKTKGYWTIEKCIEDALKWPTKVDWMKSNPSAYKTASKNKWMDLCCSHMQAAKRSSNYWTFETLLKDALNYSTRSEWKNSKTGGYKAAHRKNLIDKCCAHMVGKKVKQQDYWSLEKCVASARKHSSKYAWQKKAPGAYGAAYRNCWLELCCTHMQEKAFDVIKYLKTAGKKVGRESSKNQAQ